MPSVFDFFISILYKQLIDPKSSYYLPKLIKSSEPPYDPFKVASFPSPPPESMFEGSQNICFQVGLTKTPPLIFGVASAGPLLKLTDVTVTGLSNATLAVPVVTDAPTSATITDSAAFGRISGMQPNIALAGSFTIDQACCLKDAKHQGHPCQTGDPQFTTSGNGTFTATIATSSVAGKATVSIDGATQKPKIVVNSLTYSAEETVANIVITVVIKSISDPVEQKAWSDFATEAFETTESLQALVTGVNHSLSDPGTLADLSRKLTDALNNIVGSSAGAQARLTAHVEQARRKES